MQVYNYDVQAKGASLDTQGSSIHLQALMFTYLAVNEERNNFQIYSRCQQEDCIDKRDDGKALNIDASMVARLLKNKNK